MSKLANLKKKAADLEQRRLFDKALAVYEEVLQEQEGADEADVGLLNRVGDLLLRQGSIEDALKRYEQAVDLYVERGFQNNAIALCNKILRHDPSRAEIHFRLGQISCSKGFRTEARRHFQEYVAQLNRAGSLERAITTIRGFADDNAELDDVRQMFADILITHGRLADAVTELGRLHELYESEQRHAEARTLLARILKLDPEFDASHPPSPTDTSDTGDGGPDAVDGSPAR
ncbi:MAG: tetratricopeptide repeat protein [Gemmatimonadaceae bacterium]